MFISVLLVLLCIAAGVTVAVGKRVRRLWLAFMLGLALTLVAQALFGAILAIVFTHPVVPPGQLPIWLLAALNSAVALVVLWHRRSLHASPR